MYGVICMKIKNEWKLKKMGELALVTRSDNEGSILFALNETGAFLWEGLMAGLTRKELQEKLCAEYEATAEEEQLIAEDVEEFLAQLRSKNILEEDEAQI